MNLEIEDRRQQRAREAVQMLNEEAEQELDEVRRLVEELAQQLHDDEATQEARRQELQARVQRVVTLEQRRAQVILRNEQLWEEEGVWEVPPPDLAGEEPDLEDDEEPPVVVRPVLVQFHWESEPMFPWWTFPQSDTVRRYASFPLLKPRVLNGAIVTPFFLDLRQTLNLPTVTLAGGDRRFTCKFSCDSNNACTFLP